MNELQVTRTVVDDSLRETKIHGTPGFPIGVYLDDFSDFENGYICWHWHEEPQLTMILEGTFTLQVESGEVQLKEGDIVFINSGLLHQIRPCVQARGKLYSFIWRGELLGGQRNSDIYQECIEPVFSRNISFPYLFWDSSNGYYEKLEGGLRKVVALYSGKEAAYQLRISAILSEIWLEIYDRMPKEETGVRVELKRDQERVKRALQYMQEHYQEQISLEDIANAAFISRSELCRSFQRTLNLTPMEFLMQYRIRQAVVLLKNQDLRILDVAEMTGFCSPSHLGTHFRKYVGCSPREYRKKTLLGESGFAQIDE